MENDRGGKVVVMTSTPVKKRQLVVPLLFPVGSILNVLFPGGPPTSTGLRNVSVDMAFGRGGLYLHVAGKDSNWSNPCHPLGPEIHRYLCPTPRH